MKFWKNKRVLRIASFVLVVAFVSQIFFKGPTVSAAYVYTGAVTAPDGTVISDLTYTLTLSPSSGGFGYSVRIDNLPYGCVGSGTVSFSGTACHNYGNASFSVVDAAYTTTGLNSYTIPGYGLPPQDIKDMDNIVVKLTSPSDMITWREVDGTPIATTLAGANMWSRWSWNEPQKPADKLPLVFVGWSSSPTEYVPFPQSDKTYTKPPLDAYAYYTKSTVVSFDSGGASGQGPSNITYTSNTSYVFPGVGGLTKPGYTFMGWGENANSYANGETLYQEGAPLTLADPDKDKTFYAQWAKNYSVDYDMNGGPGTAPSSVTALAGPDGSVSVTVDSANSFTWPSYRFDGWSTNQSATAGDIKPGSTITVSGDTTLYAVWQPLTQWTVTYTGDTTGVTGAFPVDNGGPYYNDGSTHTITVQANTQTRPGYTFLGWSTTAGSTTADYTAGQTFTLTGSTTLYAVWSKNNYDITFDGNGYDAGTVPAIISPSYGATVTLPDSDLKKRGFVFDGWSNSPSGGLDYAPKSTITINSNVSAPRTLYAHWTTANSYSLSYDTNAGSDTVTGSLPATASYTADGITNVFNVTNVVPVRAGYSFLGWSTTPNGSVEYAAGAQITLNKNTTLYAQWSMGNYTLTYHFNGGSDAMVGNKPATVTGNPTTTGITVAGQGTMAREYHKFLGWKDDAGKTYNIGASVQLTSNINLYAQWKDLRNVDPTTGKTGEATLYYNDNVTGGSVVTNMPANEGGHYDDNINHMAMISNQKPVRIGYEFKGWSENAGESPSSTTLLQGGAPFKVIEDKTLYAIWELKNYTLTYNANVPSGDPPPVTGTFPGGSITGNVTAPINTDGATGFLRNHYTFKEWNTKADGQGTSYAAGTAITLSADTTLYAIWEADSYTVTYDAGGATGTPPGSQTGKYGSSFVAEQPTNLTNPGKSFAGWKDGNGNTYSPGASYPFEKNLKLTAQWATDIWTIQYDISSAEQGTAIADTTATLGNTVVLPTGANLKKSRSVFKGWNTAPDGSSGTAYAKGGNFTIAQNTPKTTILYASWEAATAYKVTYHKNASDATGEPPSVTCYNDGISETTVVPADSLTRKGYTFMGWSTNSGAGAVVEYRAGDTVEPVKAGNSIDLYAVWSIDAFTLTYDKGNPNAIGAPPATVTGNVTSNITAAPQGSLYLARHKFIGWNTEADYSGASVKPGDKIILNENKTLYAQWTPVSAMSVTYYSGCSDPAVDATLPVDTKQYYDDGINSQATISTMKPLRPGYDFIYWTTQPNGAGKRYMGGETVTMTGDLRLYAAWDMGSYTLSYDPGDSPSEVQGSMPASKFGTIASKLTVEDNSGFTRPYYSFKGWNTKKDGTGTTYQPGDKISLGMDTVLYAQWEKTTYKVTFDLNSPLISTASGTVPSPVSGTYQDKFRAPEQGDIICPKYQFMGWNVDPDGLEDMLEAGKEYNFGIFEDYGDEITLYAIWEAVPPYEVVYDKNSASATGKVPVDKNLYTVDDGNNLATVLGSGDLKWKGYEFVCWSTKKNGSGSKYVEGSQFRVTAHTKLYAQWTPGTYTLTYNKNGTDVKGKAPASVKKSSQEDITAAGKGTLTRKNYEFLGWAPKANATNATYKAGAKFRIVENTTLYAVWRKLVNVSMEEPEGIVPGSSVAMQQVSPGTKLSEIKLPQVQSGYEITGWIVNGQTITNPKNYTITKDSDVEPIVKKKPVKDPDDNKNPGGNKNPDDNKKPSGGGDNSGGGGSGGGNSSGGGGNGGDNGSDGGGNGGNGSGQATGKLATEGTTYRAGAMVQEKKKNATNASGNGSGADGNAGDFDDGSGNYYSDGSGNAALSSSAADGENGWSLADFFTNDCIIHWLVLLGTLISVIYVCLRHHYIRKNRLLHRSKAYDMIIPLLSVPLSVLAFFYRICMFDLYVIALWIIITAGAICYLRRAFQKNLREVENQIDAIAFAEAANSTEN